ncbi:translation elongation factor 4 [Myxococcota bacterium]|nr:translation elongation factor 4 [Myxococcota bacterium]MBU1382021.1 translation elongation factor 4 [Myxococcota bacterium]MBU1495337.1 translation elongation factor 4 [Myxococcota bacterium]
MDSKFIRNFSIIAHIDHGKSTLADRILEKTGLVSERDMRAQYLDRMDLERERGITIKAQSVRIPYKYKGQDYIINLIDTPGHVDFNYEVSKSLAACEGAVLVVDATQGVEAQTLANVYLAIDQNLEIIPVLNKIDLPSADPEGVAEEIEEIIGIGAKDAPLVSAKEGIGIDEVLAQVIERVPHPVGDPSAPLRALIFDSWYDSYVGAIALVRIGEGTIKKGDQILFVASKGVYEVTKVGVFIPDAVEVSELTVGDVGYIIANIKEISDIHVGDTVTHKSRPCVEPYPGFRKILPMVYSGLYPVENEDYGDLKDALEKLTLNDSSFQFEPETSVALGFGFRCGYLGLLHMEVIQERLEREYDLNLITTAPTVTYKIVMKDGEEIWIDNPAKLPNIMKIESIYEPFIKADIHVPEEYVGPVMKLALDRRGEQLNLQYHGHKRVIITYKLPLAEIIFDFYDKLKSNTRGYASMDYEPIDYEPSDLVKVDILVNGDPVDALSIITHRTKSYDRSFALIRKMKEYIPRQQYEVAIQAAIGTKIIARVTVKAFRKNVTAKCYGGDISRKRKLLEKQKQGKKRMKMVGTVEIPQEAFLAVLKVGDE